jgi:Tfp pilus assembly protein PilV
VEVVVAVVLLAVGISACMACIASATRASARAEELTAIQLMAREKLAEFEMQGVTEGEDQGDFGPERPGFGWRSVATPADVAGLSRVRLTLLWGDPEQPSTMEYFTYTRSNR